MTSDSYADNAGVRVHYEVQGTGPTLFLHHGFTSSAQQWRTFGYVDAFADRYQVIAIDARGHGRSDKPHDVEAYTMQPRTDDILAVLNAVGAERAHYWGYSMGGRTGYAFINRYPERVASLIIGGAAPGSPKLEEGRIRRWAEALATEKPAAIAQALGVPETVVEGLLGANDLKALAAAQLGLLSWGSVDPATLKAPSLHYIGERDPFLPAARQAAEAYPGAVFKVLPGLDHLSTFGRSDAVIPLVRQFLAGHTQK